MFEDAALQRAVSRALSKAKNLPSPPAVVANVVRLAQDENCRLDELATAIGRDATLSSRLLRLANSALYGVQYKITDLQQAAMVMGMRNLRQLCIGLSLSSALASTDNSKGCRDFDVELFWQTSLIASVAARELARRVGSRVQNEAFLSGLLARMGQLILARCLPESYQPVVDHMKLREDAPGLPTPDVERGVLGFDHGALGARVLADWGLPEPLPSSVAFQTHIADDITSDGSEASELAMFAYIGNLAAGVLADDAKGSALRDLRAICAERLGLDAATVDAFLLELESGVRETAALLGQNLEAGGSFAERLEEAREQLLVARGISTEATAGGVREEGGVDEETGFADRLQFAERLATHVRLRLEGFDHLCLGVLLIEFSKQVDGEHVVLASQALGRNIRSSDMCARVSERVLALVAPSTTPQALRLLGMRLEKLLAGALDQGLDYERTPILVAGVCMRRFNDPTDHDVLFREAHQALASVRKAGGGVEVRYRRDSARAA
ncbi:MAG: HDOD domain-containing protein [Planctomycetota bacterium]